MRGGGWGLGGGCRLAVMGSEGGLLVASHPWPLISTVTEWSRWQPTKSSDTDGIAANDAPNPQSKTNRGEERMGGLHAYSVPERKCQHKKKIFTSTLLALCVCTGSSRVFSPLGVSPLLKCGKKAEWRINTVHEQHIDIFTDEFEI